MAPTKEKELSLTVEEKNKAAMTAILSSFSYSFCSVSMVMSNKASPVPLSNQKRRICVCVPIFFSVFLCPAAAVSQFSADCTYQTSRHVNDRRQQTSHFWWYPSVDPVGCSSELESLVQSRLFCGCLRLAASSPDLVRTNR